MKEVGRNIRFFGRLNGKMIFGMCCFVVFFSAVLSLMDGEDFGENYLSALELYSVIMGPIILCVQAAVDYLYYLSIAVSMSSTRKNALTGMMIAYDLMLILVLVSSLILWRLLPENKALWDFRYGYIGLLLLVGVAVNIMGTVMLKAGAKIGFIVYIICYVVILAIAMCMAAIFKEAGVGAFLSWLNSVWTIVGGIVLALISMIGPYWGISKFEVRA